MALTIAITGENHSMGTVAGVISLVLLLYQSGALFFNGTYVPIFLIQ